MIAWAGGQQRAIAWQPLFCGPWPAAVRCSPSGHRRLRGISWAWFPKRSGYNLAGRGSSKRVLGGKQDAPLGRWHVRVQVLIHTLAADADKTHRIGNELLTAKCCRPLAGNVSQRLARAGSKARQLPQANHRSVIPGFGYHLTTPGIPHQQHGATLQVRGALNSGHIVVQRRQRVLHRRSLRGPGLPARG